MHDVGFITVDEELEGVAHDEDEDDADEDGGDVEVASLLRRHRQQTSRPRSNGQVDARVEHDQRHEGDDAAH